ncbi:MAG: peptidoglycan DD-metalloendopeptidase family protein [Candidatus Paceibacterota bacterium]
MIAQFKNIYFVIFLTLVFFSGSVLLFEGNNTALAQSRSNELRDQIEEHNERIERIEAEIRAYEREISAIAQERQSLEQELAQLDLSRRKLSADISLLQQRINSADLQIERLSIEIQEKERRIEQNREAIASSLRQIDQQSDRSLVEAFLSEKSLSNAWAIKERLEQFQVRLKEDLGALRVLKTEIEAQRDQLTETKQQLVSDRRELEDKRLLVDQARNEQQSLIAQTENQEENYQTLLTQRRVEKERFEQEIRDFEAQLQFILDPSSIPNPGAILQWPLDSITVTQYFGNTAFARSGAYSGNGHNGIDFRAGIGTTIRASLEGEVVATNSQVAPMCQYGKWVLIKHDNGLSTLYAHLSQVNVSTGARVSTREIIGYSGNTGYALGPHLHYTVYASAAVKFKDYTCNSGITLTIPVAAYSGYLNPIQYLPGI